MSTIQADPFVPAGPPGERRTSSRPPHRLVEWRERIFPYALNLPAILILLALIAYPIGLSFWISLHAKSLRRPNDFPFVGLDNYATAMGSSEFVSALGVTLKFAVASVALIVLFGLGLALLLNADLKGRAVLRALVLVPWAVPPIINATLWRLIFDSHVGALNGLLLQLGFIDSYRSWLIDPNLSLVMVVMAHVWNHVPLATIILLAALQAIPRELYEAAQVDRTSRWRVFYRITLPWLLRPILIVMILQTMGALRAFDLFYVLTGGGPGNSTTVLAWLTYRTSFVNLDLGLGSAYSYVIMAITLLVALFYIRGLYKRGDVE
ncbi:carbohydrate ABC transporter membrane protein 1, CUT1 family [Micromonospora rhizosphaerae]|uniref:Carbohydrate ABC transporter membrane protein 1, CUT1 family n=1 Tax=Micromonospora rhizosphaerae TaxID=568872 RepID=A0A1C6T3R5_9ACTN|nr:sugar ABC transporter permease [Micromonospora rhizosphaerae]SCL36222.1 carbohydrate ABC transporter membrane protein 1, CUT1 family [Micromonospora rhizosphaerae]